MTQAQPYSDEALRSVIELACILDDLKTRIRTGWLIWGIRAKRLESVAEHCFSCLTLANLIYPLYPDRDKIDLSKVNRMLIFHELGEPIVGDVPLVDKRRHSIKGALERLAWRKLLESLPYRDEIYALLDEFERRETPEAQYSFHVDKIDATKTAKGYYDRRKFHRLEWSLRHSELIRNNEDIQRMVRNGAKDPMDIWFDDVYAPYKGRDEFFWKIHCMLREMNTNIQPPKLDAA